MSMQQADHQDGSMALAGIAIPERKALEDAVRLLENPSLAIRLSSHLGMPLETFIKRISTAVPENIVSAVSDSTQEAIRFVFTNTVRTLRETGKVPASPRLHKAAAITTGAVSGFFGMQTLVLELPVTTGIMFRSIVDIARAEGESPRDDETILNAMQVFAMGSGSTDQDDAAETSYYGVRIALGKVMTDAMQHVARHGVKNASAPVLVRFVTAIASRFGIVVTQKAMAQTIPVVGAIGGGLVNTMFISHFQDMARGHFTVRRLERQYGKDVIRAAYRQIVVTMNND